MSVVPPGTYRPTASIAVQRWPSSTPSASVKRSSFGAQLPAMERLDPVARERQRVERRPVAGLRGRRDLGRRDPHRVRRQVEPVEFCRGLEQRRIAACRHVADDRPRGRVHILRHLSLEGQKCVETAGKIRSAAVEADRHELHPEAGKVASMLNDAARKPRQPLNMGTGGAARAGPPGQIRSAADALDIRAAGRLLLQPLKAAIQMIDAVDHRFAFGRERGDHQRHRGAGRSPSPARRGSRRALDRRRLAVQRDARAEPGQLLHA